MTPVPRPPLDMPPPMPCFLRHKALMGIPTTKKIPILVGKWHFGVTHSIHAWYNFLHLPYFTIKNNKKWVNIPYMDGMGYIPIGLQVDTLILSIPAIFGPCALLRLFLSICRRQLYYTLFRRRTFSSDDRLRLNNQTTGWNILDMFDTLYFFIHSYLHRNLLCIHMGIFNVYIICKTFVFICVYSHHVIMQVCEIWSFSDCMTAKATSISGRLK